MEICAVLGAGGGIGNAVVWELAGRGLRVRAVSRDGRARVPDGVEACAADLNTAEGAARACADAAVVYHCVQPRYTRWAEEFAALNATIVAAVTEAGAKLVVADNLYMYGPISGPISETSPQEPQSKKGRLRKQLAASLLAAAENHGLRVTIGRASDYFGPGGAHSVAGMLVTGALAGKTVRWPANADFPHTFSYLPDVARGLAVLGERDEGKRHGMGASRGPSDHRASIRRPHRAGVRPDGEALGHIEARDASSRAGHPRSARGSRHLVPVCRTLCRRRLRLRQSLRVPTDHTARPDCARHGRLVSGHGQRGAATARRLGGGSRLDPALKDPDLLI